jgi:predicted transcriptional regulator
MRVLRRQKLVSQGKNSHITGWSKARVSQEISSLVANGYLVEVGKKASHGGRKPMLLRP